MSKNNSRVNMTSRRVRALHHVKARVALWSDPDHAYHALESLPYERREAVRVAKLARATAEHATLSARV